MILEITLLLLFFIGIFGIRIVRPTHRMIVETFGKYSRTSDAGLNWIIPFVQRSIYANITEQMVDVDPQMVITKDKLNAEVDAVVYYRIKDVKAAAYNVDNHKTQLTSLARTTLRAVIGKMSLTDANENRDTINEKVQKVLDKETDSYGVSVLRVEIQRIEAPQDVQKSMNEVVKAEQKKIAAKDTASALEMEADGERRASIKKAEGSRQASILEADGKAEAIKKVATAQEIAFKKIEKSFKAGAKELKQLEVTEKSLKDNSKIILTEKGISPQLLIGELPTTKK